MTASATSGRAQGALLLCLALALAGAGAPALGQNGPTSLLPGAGSAPPTPVPPVMPPSTSPSTPPSMPGGPSGDRIQVQDLGAPDPSAVGLLDSGHGGFPAELWAGSSIATIRKAVTLLPAPQPWRSLLQLERRLLLSIAQVPPAPAGEEPLVKLRADRLWALGDLDDLTALLKVIPSPATTPALRRLQAETALLLGDNGTACDQAAALRTTAGDDPFAAKLQVYCLFAGGKGREAGLGVDLLRDQKVNDPPFFAAADTLAGIGAGHLDSRTAPSPLVLAMARLAKLPAAETTGPADPPQLRAMAGWPGDAQLAQAERAEAIGALKTEALREIYQQAVFSPAELAAPVAMLAAEKGTRGRALMFRAAAAQQTPAAKAEIIAKALSLAADHGAFAAGARLYAADIAAIPPAAELGWFAYPAARALLAAQSDAAARLWLSLARAQGLTDDGAASVAAALAPLARLAMHDEQPLAPLLAAWRKARSALPGEAGIRREQVLLGLLAALGEKVPAEDWLALLDGPAGGAAVMPRAALRELLQAAAEGRRLGETVTFALACLGDPDKADPALLAWTVSVLRHAGLEAEARAVAVEAAIASGV